MKKNLFFEAVEALADFAKRNPSVYDEFGRYQGERLWVQPSECDSVIGRRFVYLNNINGQIAKYDIKKGEIII